MTTDLEREQQAEADGLRKAAIPAEIKSDDLFILTVHRDGMLLAINESQVIINGHPKEIHDALERAFNDSPLPSTLQAEIKRLEDALHERECHPDYEYFTVETGRKSGEDPCDKLDGDGWEDNIYGDDFHSCWERFDYTEDHYFRRKKAVMGR